MAFIFQKSPISQLVTWCEKQEFHKIHRHLSTDLLKLYPSASKALGFTILFKSKTYFSIKILIPLGSTDAVIFQVFLQIHTVTLRSLDTVFILCTTSFIPLIAETELNTSYEETELKSLLG